jgi:hypothetical protein
MATTENTVLRDIYDIAFQVSPIIFHNGIAKNVPGGYLPVVALLGGLGLIQSAIAGQTSITDFSYRFRPMPGSTIINQSVGMYPFANQTVAANATIQEPLNVSLHMISPVFTAGGYATKLAQISALRTLFDKQNNSGGTYLILTPGFIYTDCLFLTMTDITGGETKQDQAAWQLDFIKPLVSVSAATNALSSLISKASSGQPVTTSSWSGPTVGSGTAMPGASSLFSGNPFSPSTGLSQLSAFIPGLP